MLTLIFGYIAADVIATVAGGIIGIILLIIIFIVNRCKRRR